MPRRPAVIPSSIINLALPADARTQLDLHLYSELEGRVPRGSYQRFFTERIREFFAREQLDLAPYVTGIIPGEGIITGSPPTVATLKRILES